MTEDDRRLMGVNGPVVSTWFLKQGKIVAVDRSGRAVISYGDRLTTTVESSRLVTFIVDGPR